MSYLIQRCTFRIEESKSKIDKYLALDYMGSAEFEFGAVGKAFKYLREHKDKLTIIRHYVSLMDKSYPIEILCIKGTEELAAWKLINGDL